MTIRQADKLLNAVEAKAKTGEARLGRVRREQMLLLDEARRLAEEACAPLESDGEISGGDLQLFSRRLAYLRNEASDRRKAASNLEPERRAAEEFLRRSVQEKLAWKKISDDLQAKRRKAFQDDQELKRDALVRSLASAKRKNAADS